METDKRLMAKTSNGDRKAFAKLVEKYQKLAWSIAYRLLHEPSEAEDVVQEAFMKIFRNAENYRPLARFNTYLTRVVTRLCYDHWKKKRPLYINPDDRPTEPAPAASPLDELQDAENRRVIRRAVDSLPQRERVAIVLQHYEGFSYREIAESLDATEKAVERLLARARQRLQENLQEFFF